MEHEALYWAVGYLLMAVFLIILGGLPLWPPFVWRNPKGVAAGSYLFRLYESFVAKARKRAAPFMKERDKMIMATAWRGDFSYITPIFGFVDGLFKNSDKLSAEQREARAFYCVFAVFFLLGSMLLFLAFMNDLRK